ncbi:hypothetical protein [Pandoraea apista]|uniref:Uncharacterized protein n=1 Tax=Pandoraea apista TaxID=93218 RepID=A0A0G4JBP8_9BURK|nr:hypothetical protein [Pandoraea apista]ALS67065.1 hypothetical protein AT395_20685 [Pandoraea apista]AVF42232.1 hypothetical protein AL486_23065 [Pandoraea apista]OXS92296.1 hypothetical protein B7H01_17750 [Pandoraea apista]RRW97128.1 hypothetical protein EGJ54_08890 [Pandoraea apista]RRX03974.1 hypothetical protein EGJ56_10165 [Pandoraea apista]
MIPVAPGAHRVRDSLLASQRAASRLDALRRPRRLIVASLSALTLLLSAFAPSTAHADCDPSNRDIANHLMTYSGQLGERNPLRLVLRPTSGGKLEGRYANASSQSDTYLTGKLEARSRLQLTEFDAGGMPRATFEGEFSSNDDVNRQRGASSTCEVISGQWKDLRSGRSVPFELALTSIQSGKIDHLYGVAGVNDDETVNRAATQFRKGVLDDRRDVVAQSIRYPLHVSLRGKTLILRNPKSLLARYNEIFTDGYVRTIGAAVPRLMFARDQGVMLGDGAVWFDANGRVIGLNRS